MNTPLNQFLDQGRAIYLRTRVNASPGQKAILSAWPRAAREFPCVELEVSWVRLSTLNHRTKAEQLREIARTGNKALFTADPLGATAQDAQYRILKSQPGFDQLKKDLAERTQQEPAVVTADGILINGNRRAAALRSLFHDDNNLNARYIRCLVLPEDATAAELTHLEAELQVAQDFKQAYSWVNQALLIEELYNANDRSFEKVAALMHRHPKDIISDYEKIQQLNQLIELSNGRKLHVDFEPNESAFDELAQAVRNKNDDTKEHVRSVYFLGTLVGVNYRDLRHLRREDCHELVETELKADSHLAPILELAAAQSKHPAEKQDDLLDSVLGAGRTRGAVGEVLDFLASHDGSAVTFPDGSKAEVADVANQVARAVRKAAQEAEEQKKDQTTLTAPITRLDQAIQNMERAREILDRSRALSGWDENVFRAVLKRAHEALAAIDGVCK